MNWKFRQFGHISTMYLERSGYFAYILTYAKVVPLNLQKQASDQSLVKGQRSSTIPPS